MPRPSSELSACYAMVLPGLESVAAEEIGDDLGAEVKKTARGFVVFRPERIDESLLRLRTTEDVYLLAWGSDALTYRAEDLESLRRWTAQADWARLLQLHHTIRPKPKGKPTYHLVTQMQGHHAYRRIDARKALIQGLAGKFPASWRLVDENASVEVWLTIDNKTAVCGLRLSDRTMRHRTWKREHQPASLRPTVAAAMVRLAEPRADMTLIDPMCGVGTILAEALTYARDHRLGTLKIIGGDMDKTSVHSADLNVTRLGPVEVQRWNATKLPLEEASVDRIVSNPPFGKQMSTPEEIGPLYQAMVPEYDRVMKPGAWAVLLASEHDVLAEAVRSVRWKLLRGLEVRVLGQAAVVSVWRKPG